MSGASDILSTSVYVFLLLQQEIGMEEYQSESVSGGTNDPNEGNLVMKRLHFGNFEVAKLRSQMDRWF